MLYILADGQKQFLCTCHCQEHLSKSLHSCCKFITVICSIRFLVRTVLTIFPFHAGFIYQFIIPVSHSDWWTYPDCCWSLGSLYMLSLVLWLATMLSVWLSAIAPSAAFISMYDRYIICSIGQIDQPSFGSSSLGTSEDGAEGILTVVAAFLTL